METKIINRQIAVIGASGRMGRLLTEILKNEVKNYEIIGIDRGTFLEPNKKLKLVIDFATAETSVRSAIFCAKHKVPLIIGSTGQSSEQLCEIKRASKYTSIVKAGNFSLGIATIKQLIKSISWLNASDIIILEKHHIAKKDAPSGTAIELKSEIEKNLRVPVQVLSERGGKEIGTHTIDIYFGDEKLSLSHKAFSRESFASGVMRTAKVLLDGLDAGLYTFDEILQKLKK